jgi:hypothetical protein
MFIFFSSLFFLTVSSGIPCHCLEYAIIWEIKSSGETCLNQHIILCQIKPLPPIDITLADYNNSDQFRSLVTSRASLRQFSRITLNIDDVNDIQAGSLLTQDVLNKFDLLAVQTTNMKVFAYLCKQGEIDIISIDFTQRLQFSMNKKLVCILPLVAMPVISSLLHYVA